MATLDEGTVAVAVLGPDRACRLKRLPGAAPFERRREGRVAVAEVRRFLEALVPCQVEHPGLQRCQDLARVRDHPPPDTVDDVGVFTFRHGPITRAHGDAELREAASRGPLSTPAVASADRDGIPDGVHDDLGSPSRPERAQVEGFVVPHVSNHGQPRETFVGDLHPVWGARRPRAAVVAGEMCPDEPEFGDLRLEFGIAYPMIDLA